MFAILAVIIGGLGLFGLAAFTAAATISAHAWRVARTNPVHALRYE